MCVSTMYKEPTSQFSSMNDIKLPTLESLSQLYQERGATNPVFLNLKCDQCGNFFELTLHKTPPGFGINGGILFITAQEKLAGICLSCHRQVDELQLD